MINNVDEAIEISENVIDYWTGLKNDNRMARRDFVLILAGKDEAVDATVLRFLPVMLYKRKKEKCIVVSAVRDEEFVKKHAAIDVNYRYVSEEKIAELCMLPSLFWLFDDIVIDSFIDAEDTDGFALCGEKGISKEDVISTGFLSLTYTPSEEQIEEARKYCMENRKT